MKSAARPVQYMRQFSSGKTSANAPSSNLGLYLSAGGVAGLGAWYAMGGFNGDIRSKIQQVNADSGDVALSGDEFLSLIHI